MILFKCFVKLLFKIAPYLFFKRLYIVKDNEVIIFNSVTLCLGVNENIVATVRSDQFAPLQLLSSIRICLL